MGNASTKSKETDALSENLSLRGNLSQRESSSTWYRYNVQVTDIYDVIEILGQGHMGEVFTVRRKAGMHTQMTRHKQKQSSEDLRRLEQQQLKQLKESRQWKERQQLVQQAKSSSKGKSGGSARRRSLKGAARKAKKVMAKSISTKKLGNEDGDDDDLGLEAYIGQEMHDSQHEPPSNKLPVKGIMRAESKFSTHSTGGDERSNSAMSVHSAFSANSVWSATSDAHDSQPDNPDKPDNSDDQQDAGKLPEAEGARATPTGPALRKRNTTGSIALKETAKKGVHFQRTFAVKTILTSRINKDQVQELVNEIMVMRKLDHPYVLKLYEVYHVKRKLWLVTELCTGGDLSSRKLNEQDTKKVIEQVLRALVYLHRMGVIHRDIKLENILYENNSKNATIRLIDFGLSKTFDRTTMVRDYARTPYTMSPETACGKLEVTDKTDVWAVGIITWIMLSGDFPFIKSHDDMKNQERMDKLKKADYYFGITWKGRGITPQAKEFVKGCLQRDPQKRWTAKQALENLQTSWGPEVDKIWDSWKAEMAKNKEPEFVRPQDQTHDDGDDDGDDDGSENNELITNGMMDENDDETPPLSFDAAARAKYIKKHVQKVVQQKKQETPVETHENVAIDMGEVERYTKFGFMKKTILITMANTMDRNDVGKLRELFLEADSNGTGTISLKDLINAFRRISPETDEKRVQELFLGIDRDKSGNIHYAEFLAALAESHGLVTLDRLTEAFDRIDTDGKGYITHEDLKHILGKDYDEKTVDQMIEEGDFKKNGKIDYEELLQLMFDDPVKGDKLAGCISASHSFD